MCRFSTSGYAPPKSEGPATHPGAPVDASFDGPIQCSAKPPMRERNFILLLFESCLFRVIPQPGSGQCCPPSGFLLGIMDRQWSAADFPRSPGFLFTAHFTFLRIQSSMNLMTSSLFLSRNISC